MTSTGFRFLLMLPLSFPPLFSFDSLHFNLPYLPKCGLNSLAQGSFGSGTPFVLVNPLRRSKIPSILYTTYPTVNSPVGQGQLYVHCALSPYPLERREFLS
ncbi:hypothetical protein F5887DRAFT_941204 [Amanita rubescens]|nr:hypothetical protein F5887DRAFT_941204 [Amanita rubescens]